MDRDMANSHIEAQGQDRIDDFLNQLWDNSTQTPNQDDEDLNGFFVPSMHHSAQSVPYQFPGPLPCGDINGTVSDLQQSSTLSRGFAHFEHGRTGHANMIPGQSDPTPLFSGFHHAMGVGNSPLTPPVDASRIAVLNAGQYGFSCAESPGYSPHLFSMDHSHIAVPTSINPGRVLMQDAACSPSIPALSNSRIAVPTPINLGPVAAHGAAFTSPFSGMTVDPAKSSTIFLPGNLSRTPSLPRSTQMAQCGVNFDNTMLGANFLQQTNPTAKDNIGILEFREQIIDGGRWPIRVISKTIKHDSVSYMLCKGQNLYFQYSEEEVLAQTLKSTRIYYATSKNTETIAQVCKNNKITQEELVARNSRLNGIERLGKKAKFKANTYLNVGDITEK